jgi:predicted metallo-beta-lactamase superfamily hydrolase
VVSHYHRDHYLYRDEEREYYAGKNLFIKNPHRMINRSQRIRSYILLKKMGVENLAGRIKYADNNSFKIDYDVTITFSPPVPHGPDGTPLGYVIMTKVNIDGYVILHASDVQGPISSRPLSFILDSRPDLLIISGPPTYFEGLKMASSLIHEGFKNLEIIVRNMHPGSTIIVDHHLLRDLNYKGRISSLISIGKRRHVEVKTAAEYMGFRPRLLEARRRELWRGGQTASNSY